MQGLDSYDEMLAEYQRERRQYEELMESTGIGRAPLLTLGGG